MTINFRRNALQLSVAALFSSAFMANAADIPQVKVTVTDCLLYTSPSPRDCS